MHFKYCVVARVFKWLFAGDYYSAFSLSPYIYIYIYIAWIPHFSLKNKSPLLALMVP